MLILMLTTGWRPGEGTALSEELSQLSLDQPRNDIARVPLKKDAAAAASKRPAQQVFKPRVQMEADERRAEERQRREAEEQVLARQKEAKNAEASAQARKRQEALQRTSQQPLDRPVGRPEVWSPAKVFPPLHLLADRPHPEPSDLYLRMDRRP